MERPFGRKRFRVTRPLKLGRDAPAKLARRRISEDEVRAVLADHAIVNVIPERRRYVLLGRTSGRPLIVVVADDVLEDATVLVSAYEPDPERGWTPEEIDRMLGAGEPEGEADDPRA